MRVALLHLRRERPHAPEFQHELDELNRAAVNAVLSLGWTPELIASSEIPVSDSVDIAARSDLVVLMGGEDVTPGLYGATDDYPGSGAHEPHADEAHLRVVRQAAELRQPLLGICRGLQLMNVAFGGTLIQHLSTLENHRSDGIGMQSFVLSTVEVDPDSDLRGDVPAGPVFCTHHQAVDLLGDDLRVVATAPDGVIEAVVHAELPMTGVQWHPEHPEAAGTQLTGLLTRLARQLGVPRGESPTERIAG